MELDQCLSQMAGFGQPIMVSKMSQMEYPWASWTGALSQTSHPYQNRPNVTGNPIRNRYLAITKSYKNPRKQFLDSCNKPLSIGDIVLFPTRAYRKHGAAHTGSVSAALLLGETPNGNVFYKDLNYPFVGQCRSYFCGLSKDKFRKVDLSFLNGKEKKILKKYLKENV